MMFWMGIFPRPFLRKMDTSVSHLLHQIKSRTSVSSSIQKEKKELIIKIKEDKTEESMEKTNILLK